MSNQQSSFQSQSFSSSSFTSSRNGEAPQTWRSSEHTTSDNQGTTIHRSSEQPGQQAKNETLHLDSKGKLLPEQSQEKGRIEAGDADKDYEERIEDEYAKREGGA